MDIRFVSREGEYLLFETSDGQRFRAELDSALKDALRKTSITDSEGVSPREVQSAIRAGESIAQVASRLGVPTEVVEPFAAPILDELRFILQNALSTSLSANDRMRSFRDLVEETYPGAEFAIRKEDSQWILESGNSLKWSYDPKSRIIEPLSAAAKELSKTFNSAREMIRHSSAPKQGFERAPEAVVLEETSEPTPAEDVRPSASVHDLVEELRARRSTEEVKPASAKGRAALPSWDEIVLGTAGLDPDANQGNP